MGRLMRGKTRAAGRLGRLILILGASLAAYGCGLYRAEHLVEGRPVSRETPIDVDLGGAAAMVSAYRAANGLGPVALSPALNAVAQAQADAMARADAVSHDLAGRFSGRLSAGGYPASVAVENIGAGYRSLADAFEGWRDSPGHRANLLRERVTEMGIAVATRPGTRYQSYWALVMASPL